MIWTSSLWWGGGEMGMVGGHWGWGGRGGGLGGHGTGAWGFVRGGKERLRVR